MTLNLATDFHAATDGAQRWDAVTVLKGFVIVQFVIPSDQRIGVLGAAGSPAILYALGATVWWIWHRLRFAAPERGMEARCIRAALYIFLASMTAAYVAGCITALPGSESNLADMTLVRNVAFVGLIMVAFDGIPTVERLKDFVRFLCLIGALYSSLGLFQFFTGISVINLVSIPGLQSSGVASVDERGGFVRAVATASHPLEYATVLSMLLPICIAVAVYDRKLTIFKRWYPVATISACSALSVSRSALIGAAAAFLIMIPTLPRRLRNTVCVIAALGAAAMYVAIPGMAGTIIGMFSGGDSSVSSRTGSYGIALEYLSISPFFGRASGTLIPSYQIFDNQYLLMMIETGIVGVLSFLLLLSVSMIMVLKVRHSFASEFSRSLSFGIFASIAAGSLLSAFFDSLSFPQSGSLIFLVMGIAGAYAWLSTGKTVISADYDFGSSISRYNDA